MHPGRWNTPDPAQAISEQMEYCRRRRVLLSDAVCYGAQLAREAFPAVDSRWIEQLAEGVLKVFIQPLDFDLRRLGEQLENCGAGDLAFLAGRRDDLAGRIAAAREAFDAVPSELRGYMGPFRLLTLAPLERELEDVETQLSSLTERLMAESGPVTSSNAS